MLRTCSLALVSLAILHSPAQAQELGFLEVQGLARGSASVFVFSAGWPEPRQQDLAQDPVLFELPAGGYPLEVRGDGFEPFADTVQIIVDEVTIVRAILRPIMADLRIVHLLPAEVGYEIEDRYGATPATVRVASGDQVLLAGGVPFCVRLQPEAAAYVRIRSGVLEEIRGASECPLPAEHPLLRMTPATPRSMILPPDVDGFGGVEVTVWVFVNETGAVVADSTYLDQPTESASLNRELIEGAAEWAFSPARMGARAIAAWTSFTLRLRSRAP